VPDGREPRRAVSRHAGPPETVRRFCTVRDCRVGVGCADHYGGHREDVEYAPGDCRGIMILANGPASMTRQALFSSLSAVFPLAFLLAFLHYKEVIGAEKYLRQAPAFEAPK